MAKIRERLLSTTASQANHNDPEKVLPCSSQQKLSELVDVNGEKYPKEVTIQPHSDDAGDAYYIGDIYEDDKAAKYARKWDVPAETGRPYLSYVKQISKSLPHLEYLASWMQVCAAPPKWKFLEHHREHMSQRASRTKVCVLDVNGENDPNPLIYTDILSLKKKLEIPLEKNSSPQQQKAARFIIVEDLSRDVVETLGAQYDIDPLFFLSHLGDYLFHNPRDRWVELPDLDIIARKRNHFNLQYLRAWYFKDENSFHEAERETGLFNVLRRLDSDRSRQKLQNMLLDVKDACVSLIRAKTSVWVNVDKENGFLTAILLVDPTVKNGFPLWRGYRPFENTPSMHASDRAEPCRETLFDDVIHWSKKMTQEDLEIAFQEPRYIAFPLIRIVLAEWRTVLKYMSTMLNKIEWEFAKPHWGTELSDVDSLLQKLSPWRRNMPSYQAMISEAIDRLFPPELRSQAFLDFDVWKKPENGGASHKGMFSFLHDFRLVQQQLDDNQTRIERIQITVSSAINIEESRRAVQQNTYAVQQNTYLARLTFMATIFIPLSFTASFLSMSPDFSSATQTIWMFFAIGVPFTIIALLIVDLSNPQGGELSRRWAALKGKMNFPQKSQASVTPQEMVKTGRTIPWGFGQ